MKIQNTTALAVTPERRDALAIAEAGLAAIDTGRVIQESVRIEADTLYVGETIHSLDGIQRIYLVAIGKCALDAAVALETVLGDRLEAGVALGIAPYDGVTLKRTQYFVGTHPMPSEANVAASRTIAATLTSLGEHDLALIVISGGGSTLLCLPTNGGSAPSEAALLQDLFRVGATIQEINTVRKHLSLVRGGFLAKYAWPARVVSLIFSDVPGDPLEFIASGPTIKDTTTAADAAAVLTRYGLAARADLTETPKDDHVFSRVTNVLLVTSTLALNAMAAAAEALGYHATIQTAQLTGEARTVGEHIAQELDAAPAGTVTLYGGETTVTIHGQGRGGRNQELALAALPHVREHEVVLALASDGQDNTPVAGALCDTMIMERAQALNLDPTAFLSANDSFTFFERAGGHLHTGPTGSNVADLTLALKRAPETVL